MCEYYNCYGQSSFLYCRFNITCLLVEGLATMVMTVKYKAVDDRKWILNIVLHF